MKTHFKSRTPVFAVMACLLLVSCDGETGSEVSPPVDPGLAPASDYPDVEPGKTSLRRLTQAQFNNIVADIFGEDIVIPEVSEPDVEISGLLSVGASGASFSARGVESLESAAFAVAEQAMDTDERRARLVPCTPSGTVDEGCAKAFVEIVGRLAWRRPLTDEEAERITAIANDAASKLNDFHDGLEAAIAALLQSPRFMFRVEIGEGEGDDRRFSGFELATRLSFFLWNTTPDAELLDAAEAGELDTDEGLLAQAKRLLESPRSRDGLRNFFHEHLALYELDELNKDPKIFEHYSTLLGPDAREETLRLMEYIVFDAEMDYRDVMTTRETFVNPRLAALYNIPAPTPEGFSLVELPVDRGRAGLLGHASLLSNHSHAVSSSATLRGLMVRTVLLCQEIPPPPVNVDTSIPEASGDTLTLRDRVAEHLENEACASCHLLTDPIGLGMENFDGIGRYRERDNGVVIDATGELDDAFFNNAVELGQVIRENPAFASCLVRTLTRYATGRVEERNEEELIRVLASRFEVHAYRVKPIVLEIVMSPMFRRPGEAK